MISLGGLSIGVELFMRRTTFTNALFRRVFLNDEGVDKPAGEEGCGEVLSGGGGGGGGGGFLRSIVYRGSSSIDRDRGVLMY